VATILGIYFCTWAAFVQGSLIAAVLHVRHLFPLCFRGFL
jgi:hypothetical protein